MSLAVFHGWALAFFEKVQYNIFYLVSEDSSRP